MIKNISTETKIFLGIIIGTFVLIGGASLLLGNNSLPSSGAKINNDILVRNTSHVLGLPDAKVTIVEFSDYECPACKSVQPVVSEVLKKYTNVRFVYREFPLPAHEYAMLAAQAAESAGMQGKFWEMHNKIFEKSPDLSKEKLLSYAQELGLDMAKFNNDFNSDAVLQIISNDQADGNAAGLSVTPTFFINGTKFDGGLTVEEFKKEIDSRLK